MSNFSPVTWILARSGGASAASDAISGLSEGLTFKGIVDTPADLPSTHNDGDMWIITDMEPSAPGNQGGKAVWYNSQWNYFDQIPATISQLDNDAQYLSSKISGGSYVDNIHIDGNVTTPSTGAHEYIISDILFKRGDSSSLANIIPKNGEPVFERTGASYRLKIGDGSTKYSNLPYVGADFSPSVDGKSVNIIGTNLQVYAFNTAPVGNIPRKSTSGVLEWIKLSDTLKAGTAISITEPSVGTYTIDVLHDGSTIKINGQNKLYVPLDNDTIKFSNGALTSKKVVAGNNVEVTTNTNNEYVVSSKFKAGTNVTFETKSDGVYINSTASGGSGGANRIEAKDGVKATTVGNLVTLEGDYVGGNYININKNASGQMEISVDQTAVENTYRPVKLNGTSLLGEEASTGYVDYQSLSDTATGIEMIGNQQIGGAGIRMQIANTGIIQAQEVGTPHRALATLTGRQISLHCGNASFDNVHRH